MTDLTQLDNLAGLAAEADQAGAVSGTPNAPAAGAAPDEPAEPSPAEQAADAVNMFANLVVGYAPAAAEVWTPEARQSSAAVMAPIFEKYGWSLTRIPPELAAAMVVGPLLYKSSTIVADKIKADRAEKRTTQGAPAVASGKPAPVPGATETGESPAVSVHPQTALY